MSVWYCIPSARPDGGTLREWKARGYRVAVWRDPGAPDLPFDVDMVVQDAYPGYAKAVNALIRVAMRSDPTCDWFVTGGDDASPDLAHSSEEIAEDCSAYFGGLHSDDPEHMLDAWLHRREAAPSTPRSTFGVMQPTGHRWGADEPWAKRAFPGREAYIDRICGSPWLGREFCRRAHGGQGPLHPDFWHMHGDEALLEYAQMLGVLWQRRDLIHFHHHWGLGGDASKMPEFLRKANSREHWNESKAILDRLKAERFASCLPIP